MMTTITTKSEYAVEVNNNLVFDVTLPVYVRITDSLNNEYFGVWLSNDEAIAWAKSLLQAAGVEDAK